MIGIGSSCPNLRCLKLKGVLGFGSNGGAAMRAGLGKLQVLVLDDTRRQALQQLASLAAAAGSAEEPPQAQQPRLMALHAATHDLQVMACLLGATMTQRTVGKLGRWLAAVMSGGTLAAAALEAFDVAAFASWSGQRQVAAQLRDGACQLAELPRVMCCWLPPQLELLQLAGCCLAHHRGRRCCCSVHASAGAPVLAAHWVLYDVAPRANGGSSIVLLKRPGDCRLFDDDSVGCEGHSSLAEAAAAAQLAVQLPVRLALRQAARPCVLLQRRLRGAWLRSLGGLVARPLLSGMAAGSGLGLVVRWCVQRSL
ncbi:hypothetical protein COO60DRAFT_1549046 [Scenedesmus sp. NREL 46B-D3]|nr:hypothetical protein COO60DRAFT_1549046 [Scenedesmus sp. NREL 46B-D3]